LTEDLVLKVIEVLSGENARKIVELLIKNGKGMSDEEISNTLNLRVNDVRRILYDLASNGFVAYKRSSGESSRWYSYIWFTDKDMIMQAIGKRKREVLRVLSEWLSRSESLPTYICPYDYSLYTFDDAFENSFRCIKCGADLVEIDNRKVMEFVKNLVNKLNKST
jgi:transcription initiation factor TFIIE subunit alpha